MNGNVSSDNSDGLAFLRVDSDSRYALINAVVEANGSRSVSSTDDLNVHLIIADYIEQIDGEPDLRDLARRLASPNIRCSRHPIIERLIQARVAYEGFFNTEPRWQIYGWSPELITLATDLYSRSALEIAVTVWHDARVAAKCSSPTSTVKIPRLEFDHDLLGLGRYELLSDDVDGIEPFFEINFPVTGVVGVNAAWMYVATNDVDRFGSEIIRHLESEWPEAAKSIHEIDAPLVEKPLGFESVRFAAESLVRQLTIGEAADAILNRLIKKAQMDGDEPSEINRKGADLNRYIEEVLNVGFLSRPTIFDSESARAQPSKLAARLVDLYERRENIFSAWNNYVDYASACGVSMREFSRECNEIQRLIRQRKIPMHFTAATLRRCVDLLQRHVAAIDVVNLLSRKNELTSGETSDSVKKIIRVAGPNSPALVVERLSTRQSH